MKRLVYGCGVIGSLLVHTLCKAGNDVTVVSKGTWGDVLEKNGLCIHHQLQHNDTIDHPKIEKELPDESFDLVFSVMQGCQQRNVLRELAKANAPAVILVGNNPEAADMEREILALSESPKTVLFGFQGTAGVRSSNSVNCLHVGCGSMTIGGLHRALTASEQQTLLEAFGDSGYQLTFEDDMEGWLYCHAAFILPIVYLSYHYGCDLRKANGNDISSMMKAAEEAYDLISACGKEIRPKGDADYFRSKPKLAALKAIMYIMSQTKLGELAATDHCRNAVTEMEWLDTAFETLRQAHPEQIMPEWEKLRNAMPSWDEIHETYDHGTKITVYDASARRRKIAAGLVIAGGLVTAVCIYQKRKK
jgi:2-dehydropantoate 2-reductase